MRLSIPSLLAVLVPALGGQAMAAAPVTNLSAADILSQFNAVVTNNFTNTSDVEGRTVVGGNMTGGATFYNNPGSVAASNYGAVNVYGNVLSSNYYNINNGGNVYIKGTNSGQFNMNGGGSISTTALANSTYASAFGSTMTNLSSSLGSLQANNSFGTVTDKNNYNINATNVNSSGVAVFSITAAQLSSVSSFNVNLGSAKTVVFNVSGNYSQNANFLNMGDSTVDSHVIWNFTDATSVSLQGFGGTVLAGKATVNNSSALNGTLFASNFSGNGELHQHAFAGVLPAADPAPLTPLGGSLAGLLGLAGFGTLRRTRKQAKVAAA